MKLPFFTVGHSDRPIDAFLALVRASEIELVADVRAIARSRANRQFDADALAAALAAAGIAYQHLAALGGLRGRSQAVPPEVNGFWTNASFHNYADYALTARFRAGLDQLLAAGRERRCAVMCAEAVWWRCHRRIVADYLIANGEDVFHIMAPGREEPARLTPGAVFQPDGTLVYPGPPGPGNARMAD